MGKGRIMACGESLRSMLGNPRESTIMMAPSILSADFLNLESSIGRIAGGADCIHVDVMDGHFVPNLTMGPPFVKSLKGRFAMPLDVHLMVSNPEESIDWYLDAGASIATVQLEVLIHANRLVRHIRERGAWAGVSVNPATPIALLRDLVEEVDLVLVMSVNPGFGGQSFIRSTERRLRELRDLCNNLGCNPLIEVDGGITVETAPCVAAEGARLLVAGSAVFGAPDPAQAMESIRHAAEAGVA